MNTTLISMTPASRLMYGMAMLRAFPQQLAGVQSGRQTPISAIVIVAAVAIGFTMFDDLRLVSSASDFAVYVVFLAVNTTVVLLRYTRSHATRRFRSPTQIGHLPLLTVSAIASVMVMLWHLERTAMLLGCGVIGVGFAAVLAEPIFNFCRSFVARST